MLDRLLSGAAIRLADEVWSDSAATLDARLIGSSKARIVSFVTERLSPPDTRVVVPRPNFVVWCRQDHQKGLDRAITFIGLLAARDIDAHFDIWGPEGGGHASLQRQVAELALERRVTFRGSLDRAQLSAIAAEASFFLLPSRFEGMSMACVEAMQLGLVPVVTDVGEMARYIEPGGSGIILDPADLESGSAKIAALLAQPERFAEMRDRAIQRWSHSPLYRDDVYAACCSLASRLDRERARDAG
ncbi:MAG: glycosyltransferase [Sphingomonadales bacterium]|nr:glycosyltransferase [Sphingomonadales bacterium]